MLTSVGCPLQGHHLCSHGHRRHASGLPRVTPWNPKRGRVQRRPSSSLAGSLSNSEKPWHCCGYSRPDWWEAVSASQVAGGLGQGPSELLRRIKLHKNLLRCIHVAIERPAAHGWTLHQLDPSKLTFPVDSRFVRSVTALESRWPARPRMA